MINRHHLAEIFGRNVKKYRIKKGLTTKELAQKTSIGENYILRIEKGEAIGVKFTQGIKIAHALGINIDRLFEE